MFSFLSEKFGRDDLPGNNLNRYVLGLSVRSPQAVLTPGGAGSPGVGGGGADGHFTEAARARAPPEDCFSHSIAEPMVQVYSCAYTQHREFFCYHLLIVYSFAREPL